MIHTQSSQPLWPVVIRNEIELCLWGLLVLIGCCSFFYHAPLGLQADPQSTPSHTLAPWFFLWVQGLLGGDQPILAGLLIPVLLGIITLLLPWLLPVESASRRLHRIMTLALLLPLLLFFGWNSYQAMQPPVAPSPEQRILDLLATQEGAPVAPLDYDQLIIGVYNLNLHTDAAPAGLSRLLDTLRHSLEAGSRQQQYRDPEGMMLVEQLQERLKRVTLRLRLKPLHKESHDSFERSLYIYDTRSDPLSQTSCPQGTDCTSSNSGERLK